MLARKSSGPRRLASTGWFRQAQPPSQRRGRLVAELIGLGRNPHLQIYKNSYIMARDPAH
ncbi:hypothetical protein [Candidatus Viridilinea mediisalina]|uniref:hypothetical protein n=1 Tax=Candidatus Viridilinea mediisalina TaxID=2024553 RepID=UPI000F5B3FE8|nr:hypothetical protein [Candidatus Viridilinea mediisalina]